MTNILITGGFGMIGRRLVKKINTSKNNILVIDNLYSQLHPIKGIKFFKYDICNKQKIEKIFINFKPKIVFHLAAIHHIPTCETKRTFTQKVNIIGTENLLIQSEKYGVEKFILASSGAVYDWVDNKLIEKTSNLNPKDNYSICKYINEKQLELWSKKNNKTGIVARIFNTIGHDDPNSHLLPDIFKQLNFDKKINNIKLGNLKPRRDYIDADDVASALLKLSQFKAKKNFDIFNISCGKEYSVQNIVEIIANQLKMIINIKVDKKRVRKLDRISQVGSNNKIKKYTNWMPKKDINKILINYISNLNS